MHQELDMKTILDSVNGGLERAKKAFNARAEVVSEAEPSFEYGIIVCALRSFGPYSEYYRNLIAAHPFSDTKSVHKHASMELALGAVQVRDELGLPIVAYDLAGAEAGNPARDHREAFQFAHENFMAKTVHAGEAYGPPSIFQAISELHADRIGHGFYLFDTTKFDSGDTANRQQYVEALTQYIADRRVTIEVCLTSNLQTIPALGSLANHSFPDMLAHELSLTICTDNRTVSKTDVTKEILLAIEHFDITPKQLKNVIVYGFKRSFFPDSYTRKRDYVRRCINYYEELVKGTALES
jgi:adenosine deaminase